MYKHVGQEKMNKNLGALHPWGRLGRGKDIARMSVFLAEEGASWVTGTGVVVDGGYLAQ